MFKRTDFIKSMYKMQLIPSILNQKITETVVAAVFRLIKSHVIEHGELGIHAFGTFRVKDRAERPGRNPQTGEKIVLPADKRICFYPATAWKRELNK